MASLVAQRINERDNLSRTLASQLKKTFKALGLRYSDVAERIGTSEKTVKRYMSSHNLSVNTIGRICSGIGITLAELSASLENATDLAFTTDAQEAALTRDLSLLTSFYLLQNGWSSERIGSEFGIPHAGLIKILSKLDKLGLIMLGLNEHVKIRVKLRPLSASSQIYRDFMNRATADGILNKELGTGRGCWDGALLRLSEASLQRAARLLDLFIEDVMALSRSDMDLPKDQVQWFAFLAILRDYSAFQHNFTGK